MDRWMEGWMDGRTDGWMDGRTDGRMNGWMDRSKNPYTNSLKIISKSVLFISYFFLRPAS
jgi:hypothetical protein